MFSHQPGLACPTTAIARAIISRCWGSCTMPSAAASGAKAAIGLPRWIRPRIGSHHPSRYESFPDSDDAHAPDRSGWLRGCRIWMFGSSCRKAASRTTQPADYPRKAARSPVVHHGGRLGLVLAGSGPFPGNAPEAFLEAPAGASCGGPDDPETRPRAGCVRTRIWRPAAWGRLIWIVVDGLSGAILFS